MKPDHTLSDEIVNLTGIPLPVRLELGRKAWRLEDKAARLEHDAELLVKEANAERDAALERVAALERKLHDLESHNKAFEKALTRVQPEHERVVSERLRCSEGVVAK